MGFARATLEQQPVLAAVPAEQRPGFANAFQQVRAGVQQPMFAMSWPSPWHGRFETGVQLSSLMDDGKLLGVMFSGYELSTRYAFEAFLRNDPAASIEHARKSPLAMFILDEQGRCSFMNERWTEVTGQAVSDAHGYGFLSTIHESDLEHFKQVAGQGNYRKEGWRLLVDVRLPNGATRRVDAAAAPLLGPDGSVLLYLCAFSPFSTALHDQAPQQMAPPTPEVETRNVPENPPSPSPTQAAAPEASPTAPGFTTQVVPEPEAPHYTRDPQAPSSFAEPSGVGSPQPVPTVPGPWLAPALKEGFTDAQLLLTPKKQVAEAAVEVAPIEPGLDKVTGLPNRLLFAQHVASTVLRMQSDALSVSVSFVDLHGLEGPRRAVGGRATNDYLFLLAKRLEATIRSIEIAGRIDGDILAILSINWLFADDLPVVAQRLLNKLGEPLAGKDGDPLSIAMSLGMAVARPGEPVNEIFSRAWAALQRAKQSAEKHYDIDFGT